MNMRIKTFYLVCIGSLFQQFSFGQRSDSFYGTEKTDVKYTIIRNDPYTLPKLIVALNPLSVYHGPALSFSMIIDGEVYYDLSSKLSVQGYADYGYSNSFTRMPFDPNVATTPFYSYDAGLTYYFLEKALANPKK